MDSHVITNDIARRIFLIRGLKVMIDRDLGEFYKVPTKALNQAVKRNKERFPENFMFRLTGEETRKLVTNCDRFATIKHSASFPYAFTEYGVAMLSSVLKSRRAIRINIQIIQIFIRLRQWAMTHQKLALKLAQLEDKSKAHDRQITALLDALQRLMAPPEKPARKIGFQP